MDNPLVQPDPGLFIWTILTFLVLLGLLAAVWVRTWKDHVISVAAIIAYAMPLFWIGLMFILQSVVLAVFVIPIATVFYIFEVVIVVGIQAFIFAALSAIYIGSAIEPEH